MLPIFAAGAARTPRAAAAAAAWVWFDGLDGPARVAVARLPAVRAELAPLYRELGRRARTAAGDDRDALHLCMRGGPPSHPAGEPGQFRLVPWERLGPLALKRDRWARWNQLSRPPLLAALVIEDRDELEVQLEPARLAEPDWLQREVEAAASSPRFELPIGLVPNVPPTPHPPHTCIFFYADF
jgi:hypothetical protein